MTCRSSGRCGNDDREKLLRLPRARRTTQRPLLRLTRQGLLMRLLMLSLPPLLQLLLLRESERERKREGASERAREKERKQ